MHIHAKLANSRVNGPGQRAVIWFQGCNLSCAGCWNPETHRFNHGLATTPSELADWILGCPDIEGVTFSGGEPLQQAMELLQTCGRVKRAAPSLSIGLYSGYTLQELESGRFGYRKTGTDGWLRGNRFLFHQIRQHLDFGVLGRFANHRSSPEKPLCGSANQQVVFFTSRYGAKDLTPQAVEIHIGEDGTEMTVTGFPSSELVQLLSQP